MDPVEQIRARLSIEELVGSYVQMKKSGRNFKALCPFHDEKTASFVISPDKGIAYCFGCRKGGDIFNFIQEIENINFHEALKILAERTGIVLGKDHFSKEQQESKEKNLILIQNAQDFFLQELSKNETAKNYLKSRGFNSDQINTYQLGFAPNNFHSLTKELTKKGYSTKEILSVGLASQKNIGDSNIYDRFRNRIMFPIHNTQGKLVAFGGRTISTDESKAKYLNSPESQHYHKGQTLYYFHKAKKTIREKNQAIIVEGYFDALTAHIYGYKQTVASLGTALTESQIKLIGRLSKNLFFAFDADKSGQNAASRSIEIAQRLGYRASIIIIPSGKDPDEAIRLSPEEWDKAVKEAPEAMEYEFRKAFKTIDNSHFEGKKRVFETLFPIIHRLPSKTEQEHYLKKLAFELEVSLENLIHDFKKQAPHSNYLQTSGKDDKPTTIKQHFSRSEHLLGILMTYPALHAKIEEQSILKHLNEEEKTLYKKLQAQYNQSVDKSDEKFHEDRKRTPSLQLLELYTKERYNNFTYQDLEEEIIQLCTAIRSDYKKHRLQTLRFQIGKNEQDPTKNNQALLEEYQQLLSDQF